MTLNELSEKLNQLSLEQFSTFIKKNYGKLLKEPKKLGLILKLYGERTTAGSEPQKSKRDEAVQEFMLFDSDLKGGDKK